MPKLTLDLHGIRTLGLHAGEETYLHPENSVNSLVILLVKLKQLFAALILLHRVEFVHLR